MRVVLIAAATLLLAIAGWWLFSDPAGRAPDPLGQEPDPVAPGVAAPVAAERDRLPDPPLSPGEADEAHPAITPDETALPRPESGHLLLDVRTQDGSPIAAFRYVLVRADGTRAAERVLGHQADLAIPLGETATVTVEASGFEPSEELAIALTTSERERRLPVTLVAFSAFTGIELWVSAADGSPIRHLEVEAVASADPATAARPLWQRRAQNDRGVYELPDLKAGTAYELRLRALDEQGETAAFVPRTESVVFTSGRERRTITMHPGCFCTVEVTDEAGQVLGQEVNLRLVHPDGSAPPTRWRTSIQGERVEREDGLPAAAPARLVDPVPPGAYVVQARIESGPVTEVPVVLSTGREPTATVRISR